MIVLLLEYCLYKHEIGVTTLLIDSHSNFQPKASKIECSEGCVDSVIVKAGSHQLHN